MKTVEINIDGVLIDYGYGECDADLVATVQLNDDGTYTIDGAYFIIDQDGGNAGELTYDDGSYDEALIERAKAYFTKTVI